MKRDAFGRRSDRRRIDCLDLRGSRIGESAGLILEAARVRRRTTIESIAQIKALYEHSDLRSRLARHHGERVDPLFRAWTGVWLSPEFRSWNIEEYLPGVLAPTLILQVSTTSTNREAGQSNRQNSRPRCETIMLPACGHAPHVDQRNAAEGAMPSLSLASTRLRREVAPVDARRGKSSSMWP